MRRVVFWMHLIAGVSAGVVVVVMAATGLVLTYERQLVAWSERHYRTPAPAAGTRVPIDLLVGVAADRAAPAGATVTIARDEAAPVIVARGRTDMIFVGPYSGQIVGRGHTRWRAFFRTVTAWHRWLGGGPERRAAGRAVTGASNLAFLFIVISGAWLWMPRHWSRQQLAQVLWFRRGLSPKARDFNWHHVVGIWTLVPLAVVVASAVPLSYPWASDALYRLVGDTPPARRPRDARPASPPGREIVASTAAAAPRVALESLVTMAAQREPQWRTMTIRLPDATDRAVQVTVDGGNGGQPHLRSLLTFDAASGTLLRREAFTDQGPGRRARALLRFAHTGEVFGVVGQTVAGLVSLGSLVLVYTGVALSWRRWRRWRARAGEPRAAA